MYLGGGRKSDENKTGYIFVVTKTYSKKKEKKKHKKI